MEETKYNERDVIIMEYKNFHQIVIVDDDINIDISEKIIQIKPFIEDYNYKLWDKQTIIELMESNQDYECLKAFNKLKPYSFKADLAKYYIVNKFGGWYSDINNFQQTSFPNLNEIDMLVFRERLRHTHTSWAVVAGYFYSKPNNPILQHAVDSIIYNTENNFYGKHALYPTGPTLFGRSIAYASFYEDINIAYGDFIEYENKNFFQFNDATLALYKPNGLMHGELGHPGSNNYADMWLSNNIYEV